MTKSINFNDLTDLQKLRCIKRHDLEDIETRAVIKIVERILHNELESMLQDIRKNIKAGIFMSDNITTNIYFVNDIEKVFSHKLIEVDGHES